MFLRAATVYMKLHFRSAQFKMHYFKVGFKFSISGQCKEYYDQ
jgi:hypothetical protein